MFQHNIADLSEDIDTCLEYKEERGSLQAGLDENLDKISELEYANENLECDIDTCDNEIENHLAWIMETISKIDIEDLSVEIHEKLSKLDICI